MIFLFECMYQTTDMEDVVHFQFDRWDSYYYSNGKMEEYEITAFVSLASNLTGFQLFKKLLHSKSFMQMHVCTTCVLFKNWTSLVSNVSR